MNSAGAVHGQVIDAYPEYANLFHLDVRPMPDSLHSTQATEHDRNREVFRLGATKSSRPVPATISNVRRALTTTIIDEIRTKGFDVTERFPIVVNKSSNLSPVPAGLQIYTAFRLQVLHFQGQYFLCLDHRLVARSAIQLNQLYELVPDLHLNTHQKAWVRSNEGWLPAFLVETDSGGSLITLNPDRSEDTPASNMDIVPRLTRTQVMQLAPHLGISADRLDSTSAIMP